jgi:RNA polymerase sigma-70 factor (ECF subfamily)
MDAGRGEQSLLSAALAGDGRAFSALVRPHLPVLYRIAARACGDSALAEDAVQETLTLAFRRLGRYRPEASFRGFLAAIAAKRARTLLRGERRRRMREEASSVSAALADPEQHALAGDTERLLRDALRQMPNRRRTAALLRLDAGLDYDEIADAMGSRPDAVRALVHLALVDLRAALDLEARLDLGAWVGLQENT